MSSPAFLFTSFLACRPPMAPDRVRHRLLAALPRRDLRYQPVSEWTYSRVHFTFAGTRTWSNRRRWTTMRPASTNGRPLPTTRKNPPRRPLTCPSPPLSDSSTNCTFSRLFSSLLTFVTLCVHSRNNNSRIINAICFQFLVLFKQTRR